MKKTNQNTKKNNAERAHIEIAVTKQQQQPKKKNEKQNTRKIDSCVRDKGKAFAVNCNQQSCGRGVFVR